MDGKDALLSSSAPKQAVAPAPPADAHAHARMRTHCQASSAHVALSVLHPHSCLSPPRPSIHFKLPLSLLNLSQVKM